MSCMPGAWQCLGGHSKENGNTDDDFKQARRV